MGGLPPILLCTYTMKTKVIFFLIYQLLLLSCKDEAVPKIVFRHSLSVITLPFASGPDSNIILLTAKVRDKQYKLVFDSGSPTSLLDSSVPSSRVSSDTVFFKDIVNQSYASFQVLVDTLQLGELLVINQSSYSQRDLNIDGILGDDILRTLVWKIDLLNRKVFVTKDIKNLDITEEGIPFIRKGPYIAIRCSISGVELDLIIDTGYSGFISMNKNMSDTLNLYHEKPIFWEGISTLGRGNPYSSTTYSPHIDTTYYFTGNVSLGNITLENEIIELRHFPLSILGMDFFKRFEYFIIDYPNQQLYLGKEYEKSLDFLMSSFLRMNTKGVTFMPSDYKAIVGRVTSSGKQAGISYLDTVLSIDGVSVVDQDSSFYQTKTIRHEEINYVEYFPSKFRELSTDFHFVKDTSTLEIKRGDSSQIYTLYRQYNLTSMPDSIHDYYIDLSLPLPKFRRVKTEADTYYFRFKTSDLLPWGLKTKLNQQSAMIPEEP